MIDLQDAVEKVRLGPERRSRVVSKEENEIVAYHEAGHALAAYMVPESDPVHKVSIIARGGAGGFTMFLPEDDQVLISEAEFRARLVVGLGGRVAEEIIFGDVTTGARGDLGHITQLARSMVTQYGMSPLGPMTFGDKEELIFLGRQLSEQRNYSEEIAEQIDAEMHKLIDDAYQQTYKILTEHIGKLKLIAHALLEHETLDADEFAALMRDDYVPPINTPTSEITSGGGKKTSSSKDDNTPPNVVPPSTAPLPA
jgi:cell division protease FtsH